MQKYWCNKQAINVNDSSWFLYSRLHTGVQPRIFFQQILVSLYLLNYYSKLRMLNNVIQAMEENSEQPEVVIYQSWKPYSTLCCVTIIFGLLPWWFTSMSCLYQIYYENKLCLNNINRPPTVPDSSDFEISIHLSHKGRSEKSVLSRSILFQWSLQGTGWPHLLYYIILS